MTPPASPFRVRSASPADVQAVKRLADRHRRELGFVIRAALEEAVGRGWLLCAETASGHLVGFVHYRHRLDRVTKVYQICVAPEVRGQGVGERLVRALAGQAAEGGQSGLLAACPEELPANQFYARVGFERGATKTGKRRRLVEWYLSVEGIAG